MMRVLSILFEIILFMKNHMFLGYEWSYYKVFILPVAPHRDWLSR